SPVGHHRVTNARPRRDVTAPAPNVPGGTSTARRQSVFGCVPGGTFGRVSTECLWWDVAGAASVGVWVCPWWDVGSGQYGGRVGAAPGAARRRSLGPVR